MTLENDDACDVVNVYWKRVPNRRTGHSECLFSELYESWWNYIWKYIRTGTQSLLARWCSNGLNNVTGVAGAALDSSSMHQYCGRCVPFSKTLEPLSGQLHHEYDLLLFSCLLLNIESTSMEHVRRYSDFRHQTSHMMTMMMMFQFLDQVKQLCLSVKVKYRLV